MGEEVGERRCHDYASTRLTSVFYGGWTTIDEIENNESHVSILKAKACKRNMRG
jgi:hypothetical protein